MKTKPFLWLGIILLFVSFESCKPKQKLSEKERPEYDEGFFKIMFYNAENLFDIYDDSLKRDDEFLPQGEKHWSYRKYRQKIINIGKVIAAVGEWQPPDLVGLCEIENRFVLRDLVAKSPLSNIGYKIIHKESPDRRGIDVALLYRPETFKPIFYNAIQVRFPENPESKTRDVLYVKGTTRHKDTLHVFVNHWPSRWGGQMETEHKRVFLASLVRHHTDSIFVQNPDAHIVIVGDLNDYPENKSLVETLRAHHSFDNPQPGELYNLSAYLQNEKEFFTHRHQAERGILDQIIVSGGMLSRQNRLFTTPDHAHVFNAPFLLEKDEQNLGYKPYRTYLGYKFHGGFSDHLPVYLELNRKNKQTR